MSEPTPPDGNPSQKDTLNETIQVSEAFHEWLTSHNEDGETMEQTIRRLAGAPTRAKWLAC